MNTELGRIQMDLIIWTFHVKGIYQIMKDKNTVTALSKAQKKVMRSIDAWEFNNA